MTNWRRVPILETGWAICAGTALAACIATGGAWAQSAAPAPGAQLPGGANSVQETFGDWRVICGTQDAAKHCTLMQEQANAQTHQRVIAKIGRAHV